MANRIKILVVSSLILIVILIIFVTTRQDNISTVEVENDYTTDTFNQEQSSIIELEPATDIQSQANSEYIDENNTLEEQETENESECETQSELESEYETDISTQKTDTDILHFIDAWGEWHDAVIDNSVKFHDYDWTYLKNDADISYNGDESYEIRKGIDVSHHQGEIDWKKVKAAGYDFAIIRIGYRGYGQAGKLNEDKKYRENIKNAQAAGLDVGIYLFSQAINKAEAEEEAKMVINCLKGLELQLPVVYDPEHIRDDVARTDNISGEQFTENTITFLEMIKAAGYSPMIYSNLIWETEVFELSRLSDYPIWYADYEKVPQTPYYFSFWQYTADGIVPGVEGVVDLDIQFIKK